MAAKPKLDPMVESTALIAVLGVKRRQLTRRVDAGKMPPFDARGNGNGKLWKLSTIRAWNPDVADKVVALMNTAETAK